ncbi:MAG: Gfo/Idh/MocA family oxidoreductase [Bryobacteraceae bacterium]
MSRVRVGVVGAGQFGQNHLRVVSHSPRAELVAVVDADPARAASAAATYGCAAYADLRDLRGHVDAAIVAVPTAAHADVAVPLLDAEIDVLVEKPLAADLASADRIVEAAASRSRVLQVGHLERYNPAVLALEKVATRPLFFEIHRMSVFSPRSLDVDVVLDLMIHDIDIVLSLVPDEPEEIRAAGISILSAKVDIANVRLQFPGGCVANLTASRVSTERVRKLRIFQPHQYISVDYARQDGAVFTVGANQQIGFAPLAVTKAEPLGLQFEAFLDSVQCRTQPKLDGRAARRSLQVALSILDKIEEHARVVAESLAPEWKPS